MLGQYHQTKLPSRPFHPLMLWAYPKSKIATLVVPLVQME